MAKQKTNYDAFRGGWRCRFYFDGKRYAVLGNSPKECEEKKIELLKRLSAHTYIGNSRLTLSDYYDEWERHRAGKVKDSTRYDNSKKWAHIEPILGQCKVQDIDRRRVREFQTRLFERVMDPDDRLTTTGVNRTMLLLSMILESARLDGIIAENPCKGIKAVKRMEPKVYDTTHRALTLEEQKLFFEYAADSWYFNLFRFMICTGCRVGEAGALTWRDIDFRRGLIDINKTVARISDRELVVHDTPKTEDSARLIPLTGQTREILEDQRRKLELLNGAIDINGRIFPNTKGGLVCCANISTVIRSILKKIEEKEGITIEHFGSHAFRDTFATRAVEQGMAVKTLQTIMGHSDYGVTMNKYAHVLPDTRRREMEKLEFLI